jgi:hypothetical protein
MELVPHSISKIKNIPKLSLKQIKPCFNALSSNSQLNLLTTKNQLLPKSFTFNLALLPDDIIHKVITYMFNNKDETSATIFCKSPLFYAHKHYLRTQKIIQLLPFHNQQLTSTLFQRPSEQHQEIIELLTPSFLQSINPIIIINEIGKKKIYSYPKEIQKILFTNNRIFQSENIKQKLWNRCSYNIAPAGMILGIAGGIFLTRQQLTDQECSECIKSPWLCAIFTTALTTIVFTYLSAALDTANHGNYTNTLDELENITVPFNY